MKKILAIVTALSLTVAIVGCGKSNDTEKATSQGSAAVDENGEEMKGTTIDGAGKEVDMKKVQGEELKADESVNAESKGEIDGLKVSIEDAKIMDVEDNSKVLVVSFNFKNTSAEPLAFDNLLTVETTQNKSKLYPIVITNLDGVNILSCVEQIDPGKSTTVQKTYSISDTESPVEVMVYKYAEPSGDSLTKVFNLK